MPLRYQRNMPAFFGTGPRTECEEAWALGLDRALLNPVTFLLDLLAVGRLVCSALLPHGRLLQAVEDRGLEALQNVA